MTNAQRLALQKRQRRNVRAKKKAKENEKERRRKGPVVNNVRDWRTLFYHPLRFGAVGKHALPWNGLAGLEARQELIKTLLPLLAEGKRVKHVAENEERGRRFFDELKRQAEREGIEIDKGQLLVTWEA